MTLFEDTSVGKAGQDSAPLVFSLLNHNLHAHIALSDTLLTHRVVTRREEAILHVLYDCMCSLQRTEASLATVLALFDHRPSSY